MWLASMIFVLWFDVLALRLSSHLLKFIKMTIMYRPRAGCITMTDACLPFFAPDGLRLEPGG